MTMTKLSSVGGEERFACAVLGKLLRSREAGPALFAKVGWPAVAHWGRESPLPNGRADFVLFHVNGSITVIKVKDGNAAIREVLRGIGQVRTYAVEPGAAHIRRVLAATAPQSIIVEALIAGMCEAADVEYFPLGPLEKLLAAEKEAQVLGYSGKTDGHASP